LLNISKTNLSGLPPTFGVPTTTFVLRFATVLRKDGQVIFMGAVTDKASDDDTTKKTRIIALDLANSTGLARFNIATTTLCDTMTVTKSPTPVDIIWVMDESGSMNNRRDNLANGAAAMFAEAQISGLDIRMGVTNVCDPSGSYKATVGKFCSKISTNASDNGGTDRFLLPNEHQVFAACLKNPPGYEGGSEYGLVNAETAIKLHLPRSANSASKIRTGATVVVIVVTDEVPQSMSNTIGAGNFQKCTLPSATQMALDQKLKSTIDYFKGTKDPQTKVDYFHAIAGVCKNSCLAQVAHGYKEAANALGGKIHDVCAKDLIGGIKQIIKTMPGNSASFKLKYTPISASLTVAFNGKTVQRSQTKGFDYVPASNDLWFPGTTVAKGSSVVASYAQWK